MENQASKSIMSNEVKTTPYIGAIKLDNEEAHRGTRQLLSAPPLRNPSKQLL